MTDRSICHGIDVEHLSWMARYLQAVARLDDKLAKNELCPTAINFDLDLDRSNSTKNRSTIFFTIVTSPVHNMFATGAVDIPDEREPLIPLNLSQHSGQTEPLEGRCRMVIPGNLSQFVTVIPA